MSLTDTMIGNYHKAIEDGHTVEETIAAIVEEVVGEAERLKHAGPSGEWRCNVCEFALHSRMISAQTGEIGVPRIQEVPDCMNGCGPMRPVTWEEDAEAGNRTIDRVNEMLDVRDAKITEALKAVDDALSTETDTGRICGSCLSRPGLSRALYNRLREIRDELADEAKKASGDHDHEAKAACLELWNQAHVGDGKIVCPRAFIKAVRLAYDALFGNPPAPAEGQGSGSPDKSRFPAAMRDGADPAAASGHSATEAAVLADVRCRACGEPVSCPRGHDDGLMDVGELPKPIPTPGDPHPSAAASTVPGPLLKAVEILGYVKPSHLCQELGCGNPKAEGLRICVAHRDDELDLPEPI